MDVATRARDRWAKRVASRRESALEVCRAFRSDPHPRYPSASHCKSVCITAKPALRRAQSFILQATAHIKYGQMGQADTALGSGAENSRAHFCRIIIRCAILIMMHIMKFTDRGISAFQHFHIDLRGNGLHVVGCEKGHDLVHGFAP